MGDQHIVVRVVAICGDVDQAIQRLQDGGGPGLVVAMSDEQIGSVDITASRLLTPLPSRPGWCRELLRVIRESDAAESFKAAIGMTSATRSAVYKYLSRPKNADYKALVEEARDGRSDWRPRKGAG